MLIQLLRGQPIRGKLLSLFPMPPRPLPLTPPTLRVLVCPGQHLALNLIGCFETGRDTGPDANNSPATSSRNGRNASYSYTTGY